MEKVQTTTPMASTLKGEECLQQLLIYHKKKTISDKISESKNDTKQLFQLINSFTICKTPHPITHEKKMDAQLAEEIASFFLDKIKKSDFNSKTLMNITQKSMLHS